MSISPAEFNRLRAELDQQARVLADTHADRERLRGLLREATAGTAVADDLTAEWRKRAETAETRVEELLAERHSTNEAEQLRVDTDRMAELETTPLAWAAQLDAKSLDNFLVSLAAAAEHEPMDGALVRVDEVIRSFREAVLGIGPDRLTRTFAPTQALPEDQEAGE